MGPSGVADALSRALANRLVANPPEAAGFEATLGGLSLRARGLLTAAVAGTPAPLRVGGRAEALDSVLQPAEGDGLALGTPGRGLRTYVAVRGGVDAPAVLGSRNTDLLAGPGPDPFAPGTLLPVGPAPRGCPTWTRHPCTRSVRPRWRCARFQGRVRSGSPTPLWAR